LQYEYIKEELGYGTIDLLCDVGGTLSLLMGASLLTCCELFEVAWYFLYRKCLTQGQKIAKKTPKMRRRHRRTKNGSAASNRDVEVNEQCRAINDEESAVLEEIKV